MTGSGRPITRRTLLATTGSVTAATAGCLGRIRRAADRETPSQLSVTIHSLPEDEDIYSLRIANHIRDNLEIAGIDATVVPTRLDSFYRDVLINVDFDLFVGRHPGHTDPDFLRPLLHSSFSEEPGWQNPFSYSNTVVDDLLELQVRGGPQREQHIQDLQEIIAEEVPFVPVAFEEQFRIYRTDRFEPTMDAPIGHPLWLLGIEGLESDRTIDSARFGTTDWRPSHNLNPIAIEYRGSSGVTDLIYEPLAHESGEQLIPWLATDWRWVSPVGATAPTIEIDLRQDVTWHDGEPVSASDVVFTFEFMQDTSLTDDDPDIPAPRFRGRSSLLDSSEAVADDVVRVQFVSSQRSIAERLLTVPILPEHVWVELSSLTEAFGIPLADFTTDALVTDNVDAIGSGPYRVDEIETDNSVTLERVSDHFLFDVDPEENPVAGRARPMIDKVTIDVRPSVTNVANSILEGGLDGTVRSVGSELYTDTRDQDLDSISGSTYQSSRLYHLGFNLREAPFTNHGLRSAISELIDRQFILEEVFRDGARLTKSPLYDVQLVPRQLQWVDATDSTFLGDPGSGTVDEEAARERFSEAGFQYSEDGELLAR